MIEISIYLQGYVPIELAISRWYLDAIWRSTAINIDIFNTDIDHSANTTWDTDTACAYSKHLYVIYTEIPATIVHAILLKIYSWKIVHSVLPSTYAFDTVSTRGRHPLNCSAWCISLGNFSYICVLYTCTVEEYLYTVVIMYQGDKGKLHVIKMFLMYDIWSLMY